MTPVYSRKFKGEKETTSIRLPISLVDKLKELAKERGVKFVDFVQDGLDQWARAHE